MLLWTNNELEQIKPLDFEERTIIGLDPGKVNLLYLTTDDNNAPILKKDQHKYRYTSRQRRVENGTIQYRDQVEQITLFRWEYNTCVTFIKPLLIGGTFLQTSDWLSKMYKEGSG